jgi:hypothetical protein
LYGKDYDKQQAIALETTWAEVEQIYEGLKHYVNEAEEQILTWTKSHTWQQLKWYWNKMSTQDSSSTPRTYAWARWDARRRMVSQ